MANLNDQQKTEFAKLVDHYLVANVQIVDCGNGVRWGLQNVIRNFSGQYTLGDPTMLNSAIFENREKAINNARETLRKKSNFLAAAKESAREDMAFNKMMAK